MKEVYLLLHLQISRSEKISPGGLYSFRVFSFHLYSCVVQRIPLRSVSFRMTRRFYVRISHLHKIQFICLLQRNQVTEKHMTQCGMGRHWVIFYHFFRKYCKHENTIFGCGECHWIKFFPMLSIRFHTRRPRLIRTSLSTQIWFNCVLSIQLEYFKLQFVISKYITLI